MVPPVRFVRQLRLETVWRLQRAGDGLETPADTFKVGDRVKAAGKRGVIAFLGDTEFASGHWAGIVLDDPVGKCLYQIHFVPFDQIHFR